MFAQIFGSVHTECREIQNHFILRKWEQFDDEFCHFPAPAIPEKTRKTQITGDHEYLARSYGGWRN